MPETTQPGRPLTSALAVKDGEHDGFGEAIHHYAETIRSLPTAPVAMKDAASRVRETFVPKLGVLRVSYADEAAAAARKRPLLDWDEIEMDAFLPRDLESRIFSYFEKPPGVCSWFLANQQYTQTFLLISTKV